MVRFEKVNKDNLDDAINISVSVKQKHTIADVVYSLAECYAYPETLVPILVLDEATPVGFVLFYINPEDKDYKFGRVMIDQKHQGQGYGRQTMLLGIEYLKSKGEKKSFCPTAPAIRFHPNSIKAWALPTLGLLMRVRK